MDILWFIAVWNEIVNANMNAFKELCRYLKRVRGKLSNLFETKSLSSDIADTIQFDFTSLYECYYEKLFRFTYTIVHNEDDCEDIVADTFVTIWENWHAVKQMDYIQSYLFTVAKNNSLKFLHKQSLFEDIVDEQFINLKVDTTSPEQNLLTNEMAQILELSINKLPERCKLIFLMAKEQKLKYKEIAGILNISEKTVQGQLIIATKRITDAINEYDATLLS